MKPNKDSLQEDIQSLLEEAVLEEATHAVWEAFETALEKLDAESLVLLRRYFDGTSAEKLAEEKGLKKEEVENWIGKVKRDLMENVRRESNVKQ